MNELITRLTEKVGISPEQAASAIETVKAFAKEKMPAMAGTIDSLLGEGGAAAEDGGSALDSMKDKLGGFLGG